MIETHVASCHTVVMQVRAHIFATRCAVSCDIRHDTRMHLGGLVSWRSIKEELLSNICCVGAHGLSAHRIISLSGIVCGMQAGTSYRTGW